MPVELSPILPLLAGLDTKQRETSLSVGASVKRQQQTGHWTGDHLVFNVNRQQIFNLPTYGINSKAAKSMGILKILSTHHPEVCAMLYEDQHGAVWCIRLNGPGLPVFQDDWFQSYAKLAVLV
ncbi:hypothetical protein [Methylovulum sp.]|jgi:hypothetical protein|uniref:hypothetical protein n=1 Tax=Methylovulum sp. TaxID=1916980 RepID=UPI0026294E71|nr:hypothetical protein [Methylovulum sp.]MDD5126050.1 hypothetical protein [Methylovulum sp.]